MSIHDSDVETPSKNTMTDVARLAGVSVKTVSRVLNNEAGVQDKTRLRVLRVMEEMGYQPHAGARALRGRAPNCVGITLGAPALDVPLSEELLAWIFRQLYLIFGSQGNYVCFDLNPHAAARSGDYARGLWERLYRGVVITGPLHVDDRVLARIHASGHPYLTLGRLASLPECSHATVDFAEGAYLATRLLIERGHRRIALVTSMDGYTPGEERRQGYLRALEEAGLEPAPALVEPVTFTTGGLVQGVHHVLMNHNVTALIDSTGAEDSRSLREGFRRAGRVIGKDVEVVAWTYTCDGTVLSDAQAHLWVPIREAMMAGMKELAEWFEGGRSEPIRVLYKPILQFGNQGRELDRPRQVFATRD
jgi:LacI family transcriptional regulator